MCAGRGDGTNVLTTTHDSTILLYAKTAQRYARKSKLDNTSAICESAWRECEAFAAQHGAAALPTIVETVTAYLVALADNGAKVSTIEAKHYSGRSSTVAS